MGARGKGYAVRGSTRLVRGGRWPAAGTGVFFSQGSGSQSITSSCALALICTRCARSRITPFFLLVLRARQQTLTNDEWECIIAMARFFYKATVYGFHDTRVRYFTFHSNAVPHTDFRASLWCSLEPDDNQCIKVGDPSFNLDLIKAITPLPTGRRRRATVTRGPATAKGGCGTACSPTMV